MVETACKLEKNIFFPASKLKNTKGKKNIRNKQEKHTIVQLLKKKAKITVFIFFSKLVFYIENVNKYNIE